MRANAAPPSSRRARWTRCGRSSSATGRGRNVSPPPCSRPPPHDSSNDGSDADAGPEGRIKRRRPMPKMTGGQALVASLHREGVRVIFGLPGVQLYGAMAALRDERRIRFVATRHEQATTYMADGYARAGGDF